MTSFEQLTAMARASTNKLEFAPNQPLISLAVLFGEPAAVMDELSKDVRLVEPQRSWSDEHRMVSLDDAFVGIPLAGAAHKYRVVAFALSIGGPVIHTANIQDGWGSLAYRVSKKLNLRALLLRFSVDDL